jgi:hypothetical protein
MADILWKVTGATIVFTDRFRLRDGQNRMFACIKAGKPFSVYIVFAVDDEAFPWMDRGKPRSGADALTILGIENAKAVSAAVRWLELIRTDRAKDRIGYTPPQILEALKSYDQARLDEAAALARRVYNADQTPLSMATALAYLFGERSPGLRDRFFDAWAKRNWAPPMRPLRFCAEEIRQQKEYSQGRVHETVRCALWIIAWNSVVQKKRARRDDFKWRKDERFPQILG